MRASLVMFLAITMFTTLIYLLYYEVLDMMAARRGLVFAPVVIAGVLAGSWLFRPSLEGFYRRFCLVLLLSLAGVSLVRAL